MSPATIRVLDSFNALCDQDRKLVVEELEAWTINFDTPELSGKQELELAARLADEAFLELDKEEAALEKPAAG